MAIPTFTRFILTSVLFSILTLLQGQTLLTASLNTPGGAGILSEKCGGPYQLIIRRGLNNHDTTLIFISDLGVAQAGQDYNFPPGSFPVTMLPKDSVVVIPINVVNDALIEGLESLIWEIAYLAGINSGTINLETSITDSYSVSINNLTDTIKWCRDIPFVLLASSDAEIHWSPSDVFIDSTGESATLKPQESGWYFATVGSKTCGAKDSIYFNLAIVDITNPDTVFICKDGEGVILNGTLEGLATDFKWIPTDSLSSANSLNPEAKPIVTTTYVLQSNIGVCTAFDRVVVRVDSLPEDMHIDIAPFKDHYCAGEMVALFSPSFDSLDFPDIEFNWIPYTNGTFDSDNGILNAALTLQDTTWYIRENFNNACSSTDSILINVVPSSVPISVSDTALCPGASFNVMILSNQVTEPEWTPEEGLSCTKCLNPNVTVIGAPGSSQSYQFSGKILECPVGANLNITIPDIEVLNIQAFDHEVCAGDTTSLILLNPEGLFDVNWTIPSGNGILSCPTCSSTLLTVNSDGGISILIDAMVTDHTKYCGAHGFIQLSAGQQIQVNGPAIDTCLGSTAIARTGNSDYTDVTWDVISGQLSLSCTSCPNPIVTVNSGGILRFFAESNDPNVCKVIGAVSVSISSRDASNLLITPDPATGIGQGADVMASLNFSPPPASVTWTVNGVTLPTKTTTVTFNAGNEINFVEAAFINSKGCEQIDTISFPTVPPDYKIPNAFTPNNDMVNDNFKIIINGNIVVNDFMIFNRWGQLVYKAADNDLTGWNGMFKNQPAASDTYVYKATLRFPDGKSKLVKGDVILLR
ncbi:MAG: gliding motility-associated C-terminal domain-containing protein [Saprospiraceae bacterium]